MAKAFVIDVAKCSGCYNCQLACKDEHAENDWTPYAKPQPLTGQFWSRVTDHVQGTIPKVRIHYIPRFCNHCRNAACMEAAKDGAVYRREDGLVIIDPEKAAGQKQIADACPYGADAYREAFPICASPPTHICRWFRVRWSVIPVHAAFRISARETTVPV